jgi:hypothetical protein
MRTRGIQCNVHTYSALMNVCIKVSGHDGARRGSGCLLVGCCGRCVEGREA